MKKIQLAICKVLCVLCCYFFVVSCNKTEITPENLIVTNEKPIASMAAAAVVVPMKLDKETSNSSFNKYSYDATGRCIRIDMGQSYITYSYRETTIIGTRGYTDPTKAKIVYTYILNTLGLASKCTYTIGTKNHILEYVHNSNRQVTKITHKSKLNTSSVYSTDDTNTYAYDADGNNHTRTYQLTFVKVTFNYEHDKTHLNTTGNEFKGLDWLGKSSKNVLSFWFAVTESFFPYSNSISERTNYNWTYDAQGYNKQYTTTARDFATFTYK